MKHNSLQCFVTDMRKSETRYILICVHVLEWGGVNIITLFSFPHILITNPQPLKSPILHKSAILGPDVCPLARTVLQELSEN